MRIVVIVSGFGFRVSESVGGAGVYYLEASRFEVFFDVFVRFDEGGV